MIIGKAVLPFARAGSVATELAIHGSLDDSHYFKQLREGVNGTQLELPKIQTMHVPEQGKELDINRYSSRIMNKRALLARVIGLDELPQWELVAAGDMSLVGPRPLLIESKDRFSSLAEEYGMPVEEVEEWREFLGVARPGLFGKSQAMRHRRRFNEYTPAASAAIINADLSYKKNATVGIDLRTALFSATATATEGVKSIK